MPSRAWVVTKIKGAYAVGTLVSMPSRAWVVTARMSNILNFSWCFLCIPAIYRCILAHLPIFFNQLSKFLRCESPSTFLGTCLSHHSFIIFLVTNTNTLLSGLYLISTKKTLHFQSHLSLCVNALSGLYLISTLMIRWYQQGKRKDPVSMPSRAYTSFLLVSNVVLPKHHDRVNALLGLYLISTWIGRRFLLTTATCQCPLELIPHFYVRYVGKRWHLHQLCQCPLGLIPHFYR